MLSELIINNETIRYSGGEFLVRGIGLDTIAGLMSSGLRDELDEAVEQLRLLYHAEEGQDQTSIESGVTKLIMQLPGLTASLIAFAANEPAEVDKVRKLPLPVQLAAVLAIGRLTFEGDDAIKNFVAGLTTLMQSLSKTAQAASQIRLTGTKG